MNRRIVFVICLLSLVSLLFSCNRPAKYEYITNPSKYDRLNDTVEAIFSGNSETLYNMFSSNAKKEAPDLKEDIEHLMSYVTSENVHDEINLDFIGGQTSDDVDDSKRQTIYSVKFHITTASDTYLICLDYCSRDDFDGNNIGLTKLIFINETDEEKTMYLDKWYRTDTPGVYVPK